MHKYLFGMLLAGSLLAGCTEPQTAGRQGNPNAANDILAQHLDTTTHPGDDFFQYANGGWIKANPIPAEESGWGIAHLVNNELYERKKKINEEALASTDRSDIEQKIADFWSAGMDSASIENAKIAPLKETLDKINAAATPAQIMSVAAQLHTLGVGVFFGEGAGQDSKNSAQVVYYLMQGGLGMPNRDYYLKTDARTAGIRNAYVDYVAKVFGELGVQDEAAAQTKAKAILALETKMAKASRPVEALRDPYANYNKMTLPQLQRSTPGIDWKATLATIGAPNIDTVVVGQPEFLKTLNNLVTTEKAQTLRDYMAFHTASEFAPNLHSSLRNAQFAFYGKTLRGAKEQRPRWKQVLDAEEGAMGEALGNLFAKEYFDEKAKARYSDMVERVRDAYRIRIEKLHWMTDSTKKKALHKLATMRKKVGYPDTWKDFSAMQIGRQSYAANMMASAKWWNNYSLAKLGKPVDRTEWDMTPQTYNAYYNPSNNEIVLPAGIFTVPGKRDEELDDALVYGYAAASTIGHEITHGFDDEGRQFDAEGNLKNWWTKSDEVQFTKRANVLATQFSGIVALDSTHINGNMTLGENLADLGGLLLGVDAFKTTEAYKSGKPIAGLLPMQRFFLGYALGWLYSIRPEALADRLITDVHSPAKWRVNGPYPNVPAFYEAFNVKPGDKMYLPDNTRVKLW